MHTFARSGPYIRTRRDTRFVMLAFILATLPAAGIGLWSIGRLVLLTQAADPAEMLPAIDIWQLRALDALGISGNSSSVIAGSLLGVLLLAPALLATLAVSRAWAEIFARVRARPVDPGWALTAWLFVLLLPAGMPLHLVTLALSFGLVFGCYVFGGTGRYLVNPALLGSVFLLVAYPSQFVPGVWILGTAHATGWETVAVLGPDQSGVAWIGALFGTDIGAFGTSSAAACGLGALLLVVFGIGSWRIMLGALGGVVLVGLMFTDVPWYWQPVLGSFAFVAAFIATDPTTMALTATGRWLQGALFGALTILLRMLNPEHPEGTLFALLLATLVTPAFDHLVTRRQIQLRQKLHAHDTIAT